MDQTPSQTPASSGGGTPPSASGSPPSGNAGGGDPPGFFGDLFQTRYREVTLSAILLAVVIGVVMNAAITYAGLKIGFTLGGSAIAAVIAFGILRGLLRRGSILETNIAQTVASAVNTSNSGVIFTVPVLLLIGYQLSFGSGDFWLITLACMAGGILGTAFIIPLRKQMLDIERLRFPSATGVAMILKSPGAGAAKAIVLVVGILLGALIYLPAGLPALQTAASVDQIDGLFERGKIAWEDHERTRMVAGWIEDASAPAAVRALGAAEAELEAATAALAEAEDEDDAAAVAAAEVRLAAAESAVEAARAAEGAFDVGRLELVTPALARAVDEAVRDERDWTALRDTDLGWAAKPMFGYSNLDVRLAAEEDPEGEARDRDGDGTDDVALTTRVDRDDDGRPDLVVTDTTVDVGRFLGLPDQVQLMFAIAPFALGAGYITGRAGLFVLAGGILAFFVINPVTFGLGWMPATVEAHEAPGFGFGAFNRPLGIGLLLGGALMGVLFSLPAIKEALRSIAAAGKVKGGGDELGLKTLIGAAVLAFIFLFLATDFVGNKPVNGDKACPVTEAVIADVDADDRAKTTWGGYTIALSSADALAAWEGWDDERRDGYLESINAKPGWLAGLDPHLRAALVALIGGLWIWFAGIIIAQCTGMTDWSPISGMALLTVVLVMLLAGTGAVVGAVLIGAALCVAITLAADMMGDMKTGYLVGAKPRRQQIVEMSVVAIGPIICMLTILLIAQSNMKQFGVAIGPGTPTVAPQAQALQAVITGVQGGEMPYALYGFGAALGAMLGLGAFSGLGVLVGLSMYLPFMYIATYGIGCVLNMVIGKVKGRAWAEEWGVPFAAGLVVGESILALLINFIVLLS